MTKMLVRALLLIATLCLVATPLAGQTCQSIGGGCADYCGPQGMCSPSCSACGGFVDIQPNCKNEDYVGANVTLTVVHGEEPYTGWEPGTVYSCALDGSPTFDNKNMNDWGDEIDEGLAVTGIGCLFTLKETASPDVREIVMDSLYMTVGSFNHEYSSPTGTNTYALRDGFVSLGTVDTTTGQIDLLKLYSTMTNAYFSSNDPATLLMLVTGELDIANDKATLVVDGMSYEDD